MPALVFSGSADQLLANWAAQSESSASLDGLTARLPEQTPSSSKAFVADFERSYANLGTAIDEIAPRFPGVDRATVLKVAFAHVLGLRGYTSTSVFGAIQQGRVRPCQVTVEAKTTIAAALKQAGQIAQDSVSVKTLLAHESPVWGATIELLEHNEQWSIGEQLPFQSALHLAFRDGATSESIEVRCVYNPAVLLIPDVTALLRHVQTAAVQIASAIDPTRTTFSEIDVRSEYERTALLSEFARAADRGQPRIPGEHKFLQEYVNAHATSSPNTIAVQTPQDRLSYRMLNSVSNSFAHTLLAAGVRPGDHVGLFMNKSSRQYVAILAMLKVGACVTPLGIENPAAKNLVILRQTGAPVVVCDEQTMATMQSEYDFSALPQGAPKMIDVSKKNWRPTESTAGLPDVSFPDSTPAYIIYTSGTTGEPKGVLLTHANIVSFCRARMEGWNLDRTSKVLQLSNYVWDVSVGETVTAFSTGCCLYAVDRMDAAVDLAGVIERNKITHTIMTPTMARLLEPVPACLQAIYLTGEPFPVALRNYLLPRVPNVLNGGAPSEVTILALTTRVKPEQAQFPWTPFGKPMGDVNAYVVDDNLRQLPIGAVGELCLSGLQVSAGYLKRPEVTSMVFLPNPYKASDGSKTLYRTGDLARLRGDGEFELLGRRDGQIKFHGIRLESLEIESTMMSSGQGPAMAGVTVAEFRGVTKLCGFAVLRQHYKPGSVELVQEEGISTVLEQIKAHVASRLSSHAVPSQMYAVRDLPRTLSGKVDRRGLAALASEFAAQQANVVPAAKPAAAPVAAPAPATTTVAVDAEAPVVPSPKKPLRVLAAAPAIQRSLTANTGVRSEVNSVFSHRTPMATTEATTVYSDEEEAVPKVDASIANVIRNALAEVLQVKPEAIVDGGSFLELGGDSLGAIRLSIALRKLGMEIDARNLYNGASLDSIAKTVRLSNLAPRPSFQERKANVVASPDASTPDAATFDSSASASASSSSMVRKIEPDAPTKGAADLAPFELDYVLYRHSIPSVRVQDAFYGTAYQRGSLLMAYAVGAQRPQSIEWNSLTVDVRGDPTAQFMQTAWEKLVRKHTALRTVLATTQSFRVANVVLWPEYCRGEWTFIDATLGSPEQQDKALHKAVAEHRNRGYQMGELPWRMVYARATKDRSAKLVWNFAHSCLDGWSLGVLNNDLTSLLNARDIEGSNHRLYSDFIHSRNDEADVKWLRQNLMPLPSTSWPIREPSKTKKEPVCQNLFYTEWNLDFNRLAQAMGVSPFAACLAAVGLTVSQREKKLDTDGAVSLGYISSGRTIPLEGASNVAGCCLDLLFAKLNPRMDKSGRAYLGEAQTLATAQMGRDHVIHHLLDPRRRPTSNMQVCLVYQNFQEMATDSAESGDKYGLKRSVEHMPTCCALLLEVFPQTPRADGTQTWSVRASYDRAVLPTEQAAEFVDDTFVHLRRLLVRADEDIERIAILQPGDYTDDVAGEAVLYEPTPLYERRHESFHLPAIPGYTGIIRMFAFIITMMLFNLRLSMAKRIAPAGRSALTAPQ